MNLINIDENGLHLVFQITEENEIKFLHFSSLPFQESDIKSKKGTDGFRLVELKITGQNNPGERRGSKYVFTSPGYRLKYRSHQDYHNEIGRKLEITTFDPETQVEAVSHMQFYTDIPVIRSWTEVTNNGTEELGLEYVSSFALTGIEKEGLLPCGEKMRILVPHHSWQQEMEWRSYTFDQVGLYEYRPEEYRESSKEFSIFNTGNWSTKKYLPMGYIENTETHSNLFWQIEHNGSWYWEISDEDRHLYLQLSGPDELHSHWWKNLKPGGHFCSVPVCVGSCLTGFDGAMGELTKYRRIIRRKNDDNIKLNVIFNDYMNCLHGDPTTEKELPLIDAASKAGCEYFCIDAGWYSAGPWWDGVGEWLPSKERFPNGFKEVTDYIRAKGMIPGAWLELEVMGINCPKADKVSKDWFFQRHGKCIYERSRYQLDFRNPEVVAHSNEVIDRLVNEYGIGYIKMDYNIEPGIGTEVNADSPGDGLLEHNRAYIAWLDSVFQRHPNLIIENCSSGGLRMDYAMLSRYSIQSTSDEEDYRRYATIAANAPAALTPEQAAVWSYPLTDGDCEETIFNMVNALLLRIHQSGHLVNLSAERSAFVKEGIAFYKKIRQDIKQSLPFWPLGLAKSTDTWLSLGLKTEKKTYVAVWRRNSESDVCSLPIHHLKGKNVKVVCGYPQTQDVDFQWNSNSALLTVKLPHPMSARIFEIELE